MPTIFYTDVDGTERSAEAKVGQSVMEVAISNSIPGIDADCGGACACATCHVYVDDSWTEKVGGPGDLEKDLLEFADDVRDSSRLSCQISVTDDLDGLKVATPASQG